MVHHVSVRRLFIAFLLTVSFMIVEVIVGLMSNSLAILSDAGHMLNDSFALILSLSAVYFGSRKASSESSYGYKRTEVIAAFINGTSLIIIAIYIMVEAIQRIGLEFVVDGELVVWTGIAGLLINILAFGMLHDVRNSSTNIKAVYVHVMSDLLGSVGAIITGLTILFWNLYWMDIVISIIIAGLIINSAIPILKNTISILMEFSPREIDVIQLKRDLLKIGGVLDLHDFHTWQVKENENLLTAHLQITNLEDYPRILSECNDIIQEYGIKHSTLQLDPDLCQFNADCAEVAMNKV